MKTICQSALATLILGSMAWGPVSAGPFNGIHPLQSDRFSFGAGGFFPEIDGDIFLDESDGDRNADIDLQDDLGFDDSENLPAVGFMWRLSNTSRIQGEYFEIGQSNTETLEHKIDWGDLDFQIGAKIKSNMDLDIARVFYGYSFVKDDKKEVGAGLGLHYLSLDASLSGSADLNGVPVVGIERGFDDWAILPNIGAYGNYAFSSKWLVSGRVDWISANIGDYDGGLWNFEAAVQYQAFRHFGVGLAYRYLAFNIEKDDGEGNWGGDLDYAGPLLFFTTSF